jgi:hypothetical protein
MKQRTVMPPFCNLTCPNHLRAQDSAALARVSVDWGVRSHLWLPQRQTAPRVLLEPGPLPEALAK